MHVELHAATAAELETIKQLLSQAKLPIAGVDDHWKDFLVARDGEGIVGCGGAEIYDSAALIRSMAVRSSHRSRGIGQELLQHLLENLKSRGIREFYLLTTTAAGYFDRHGFERCERAEVPKALLASREFQDGCCSSAVCMRMRVA